MASIHPLAVVSPEARLGEAVSIGPFCVVEAGVEIGDGCRLASHAVVKRGTILGPNNQIGENAVLGGMPQHVRGGDRPGTVRIGSGNTIREFATIHRALEADAATTVGNGNLLMVNAHIGHDCEVGNDCVIANNVMLGGHSRIDDRAYLSGAVAVHQFCRIGRLTMVGGQTHVTQDIPPFVLVDGKSNCVVGLNTTGLRRADVSAEDRDQLKAAYRVIYRSPLKWKGILAALRDQFRDGLAAEFEPFLSACRRGIVRERRGPRAATLPLAEPGSKPGTDEEKGDADRKAG